MLSMWTLGAKTGASWGHGRFTVGWSSANLSCWLLTQFFAGKVTRPPDKDDNEMRFMVMRMVVTRTTPITKGYFVQVRVRGASPLGPTF